MKGYEFRKKSMKNSENMLDTLCIRPCGRKRSFGFLHIGGDVAVRTDDIIGIFDLDNTTVSRHTKDFLNKGERQGMVENLAPDIPVSFVVVAGARERIYLSPYSPRLLTKHCIENLL